MKNKLGDLFSGLSVLAPPSSAMARPEISRNGVPGQAAAWWHKAGTNGWAPLPDWALFFLGLGSTVASVDEGPSRAIVAITTPTRAFASALCATGVVLGRSITQASIDPALHYAYLRTLEPGTIISLRPGVAGSKIGRGTLIGFETVNGEDYILLSFPGENRKIPAKLAHRIEPVAEVPKKLPSRLKFTPINLNADLISGLIGPDRLDGFIGSSRLDCVVVGNRRLLRDEIVEPSFGIMDGGKSKITGSLQDVVRARVFQRDGGIYHSDVVSVAARVRPARLASTPAVAIFDGSRSFLRWSGSYPSASWIIVLDRSDRRLTEAIATVDGMYASRARNERPLTVKAPPEGIECTVFEARSGAA